MCIFDTYNVAFCWFWVEVDFMSNDFKVPILISHFLFSI